MIEFWVRVSCALTANLLIFQTQDLEFGLNPLPVTTTLAPADCYELSLSDPTKDSPHFLAPPPL